MQATKPIPELPNIHPEQLDIPSMDKLAQVGELAHPPHILEHFGAYYDRVVDVMEELFKITLLTRGRSACLTDRYSERNARALRRIDAQIASL